MLVFSLPLLVDCSGKERVCKLVIIYFNFGTLTLTAATKSTAVKVIEKMLENLLGHSVAIDLILSGLPLKVKTNKRDPKVFGRSGRRRRAWSRTQKRLSCFVVVVDVIEVSAERHHHHHLLLQQHRLSAQLPPIVLIITSAS